MALGGGTFITQNKTLPGAYINFVSTSRASAALSDRGVTAMAFSLDWGADDTVFEVTSEDFIKNTLKIFGYSYTDEKLKGLRDLFKNTNTLYAYRLNTGEKSTCEYATAKCSGIRGNALKLIIGANVDNPELYDMTLYLGSEIIDVQTISAASELVDNDFVIWNKEATLIASAGVIFTGGTNGEVMAGTHQKFLEKIESYAFNALGVVTEDEIINQLYAAFTKRMRDEMGVKFQAVVYNYAADNEGVVNVKNCPELCYWVTGIIAGCGVNASNLNKLYDGEYDIPVDYTQSQLETAVKSGEFVLHKVGGSLRVLMDINSLVSLTAEKSADFKENQTIRVIDQIANDIAAIFVNKYLGVIPNDDAGRASLWSDIVKHHQELERLRAIEGFDSASVIVEQGDTKKSVMVTDMITPVNAMAQLYMTVYVQ